MRTRLDKTQASGFRSRAGGYARAPGGQRPAASINSHSDLQIRNADLELRRIRLDYAADRPAHPVV